MGRPYIRINDRWVQREVYPDEFDFNLVDVNNVGHISQLLNYNNMVMEMHIVDESKIVAKRPVMDITSLYPPEHHFKDVQDRLFPNGKSHIARQHLLETTLEKKYMEEAAKTMNDTKLKRNTLALNTICDDYVKMGDRHDFKMRQYNAATTMGSIVSAAEPSVMSNRESVFNDSVISNKKNKRGATADNYY